MRPIKFRGKTELGRWIYGYYCVWHNGAATRHYIAPDPRESHFSGGKGVTYDIAGWQIVLPQTVGQFTGIKDKKRTKEYPEGQEIYEGAIVKVNSFPQPMEVYFKEGQFGWGRKLPECHTFAGFIKEDKIEVIGSVHENPELLNNGKV